MSTAFRRTHGNWPLVSQVFRTRFGLRPRCGRHRRSATRRVAAIEARVGSNDAGSRWSWRALLVDDEPRIRQMVRAFLEADGFDVVEATDGSRALAIARGGGIDLVRCDVAMPAMDGLELVATSPGPGRGATFTLALVDTTGPLEDFDAGTKGSV